MPDGYDDSTPPDAVEPNGGDVSGIDGQLSALLDGELAPPAAAALQERVAAEPELAQRLLALRRVGQALRDLPAPEVPGDLAARLRTRIAESQRGSGGPLPTRPRVAPPWSRRRIWTTGAGLAAAAAVLAFYLVLPSALPELPAPEAPQAQASLLASAQEDELGIALYYEELADLEVLEQLELLEILVAIEEAERG